MPEEPRVARCWCHPPDPPTQKGEEVRVAGVEWAATADAPVAPIVEIFVSYDRTVGRGRWVARAVRHRPAGTSYARDDTYEAACARALAYVRLCVAVAEATGLAAPLPGDERQEEGHGRTTDA